MTTIANTTAKLHHATKAKAVKLEEMLAGEYPVLSLVARIDEDLDKVTGFAVIYDAAEELGESAIVVEGPKVPELADIFAACDEQGLDPEAIEAEEGPSGSVVPEAYRAAYKANPNTSGQTCGDFLAVWLEAECHGVEGFDPVAFERVLQTNEVDQSGAWARLPESGQRGWVGRWRMNGRQKLEQAVALSERLRDGAGEAVKLPKAVLAELQRKHAKAIERAEKAAAKEAAKAAA